jgi:predicted GNAT family acetyltransferase
MQFKLYTDVHEFYNDTYDVLMRHEAQNLIPLGNIIIGHEGKDKTDWRDPVNWFMATISDNKGIHLTAIMTPPHNITLYATDNTINPKAINCLIDGLENREIPGVMSEKDLSEYFAKEYTLRKGKDFRTTMNQRIYELTAVNPDVKKVGIVRLLNEKDMPFFPYWAEAFYAAESYGKTEMSIPQDAAPYLYRITQKKLYVLEDNKIPVSMAGYTREMQTVIGVAFVYTPPYERRKGYATSIVAQISQFALDKGFNKCVLYTDLANPTSNSIYQKIGYIPICDSLQLKFE